MAGAAAGIQAAGSIGGGLITAFSHNSANKANIKLNRENRDWMEKMSNTAWSRQIGDMLHAGINPMLAVSQGPASTPGNSAATVSPVDGLGRGITSAGSVAAQAIQLEQAKANIELTRNNAYKARQEGNSAAFLANPEMQGSNWDKQQAILKATEQQIKASTELSAAQKQQILEMLPLLKNSTDWGTKLNEQLTHSAKAKEELDKWAVPEAKATAEWFSQMGTANRGTQFMQTIMQILKALGGK